MRSLTSQKSGFNEFWTFHNEPSEGMKVNGPDIERSDKIKRPSEIG